MSRLIVNGLAGVSKFAHDAGQSRRREPALGFGIDDLLLLETRLAMDKKPLGTQGTDARERQNLHTSCLGASSWKMKCTAAEQNLNLDARVVAHHVLPP